MNPNNPEEVCSVFNAASKQEIVRLNDKLLAGPDLLSGPGFNWKNLQIRQMFDPFHCQYRLIVFKLLGN